MYDVIQAITNGDMAEDGDKVVVEEKPGNVDTVLGDTCATLFVTDGGTMEDDDPSPDVDGLVWEGRMEWI